jgi:RIP metalloprotease RseP
MALSVTNSTGAVGWMPNRNPLKQLAWDAGSIFRVLKGLVTPKESKATSQAIGGPVMIAEGLYRQVRRDIWDGIGFLRFLNVNLAILNLLPIPVLDGGLILFSLIALVFRRRVPDCVVKYLSMAFMVVLMGLMGLLVIRDSYRSYKIHTYQPETENVQTNSNTGAESR